MANWLIRKLHLQVCIMIQAVLIDIDINECSFSLFSI